MLLLKSFKMLKASSLVESVMAISIISIAALVACMVYLNVVKQNKTVDYYEAKHHVNILVEEMVKQQNYDNDVFIRKKYAIEKEVTVNKKDQTVFVVFTIRTGGKSYVINKLIPYYES
ncbi:hypothetical protein A8C32_10465 [Flavivirga aquatica]|uniref:Uncharacterized protein n=1 Tax=Flavivirga aquatica TaxID=1849968 RepID=A0A1E5TCR3_9FLAO|nr:hypothetical protein [Flavivirga aquatica]OEK09148.1 hypothetical protein A8C32_10465 [Flavivirga aquatica]